MTRFLLRVLLLLIVFAAAAVAGYVFIGDMDPETDQRRVPVEIDASG